MGRSISSAEENFAEIEGDLIEVGGDVDGLLRERHQEEPMLDGLTGDLGLFGRDLVQLSRDLAKARS